MMTIGGMKFRDVEHFKRVFMNAALAVFRERHKPEQCQVKHCTACRALRPRKTK